MTEASLSSTHISKMKTLAKTLPANIPEAIELTDNQIPLFGPPSVQVRRDSEMKVRLRSFRLHGTGLNDLVTQDLDSALSLLPLKEVPDKLRPRKGLPIQPPVFRLGYPVTSDWMKGYAARRGVPPDFQSVIDHINANCEAESLVVRFGRIHQLPCMEEVGDKYWFLSIWTTYTHFKEGEVEPSEADKEKLRKFLQVPRPPAWFLDRDERRWGKKGLWCRY